MPLLGDVLVIAGTVGFAFSNVGEVSYALHASAATSNSFSVAISIPFSSYV
jgi:hypothetical protein